MLSRVDSIYPFESKILEWAEPQFVSFHCEQVNSDCLANAKESVKSGGHWPTVGMWHLLVGVDGSHCPLCVDMWHLLLCADIWQLSLCVDVTSLTVYKHVPLSPVYGHFPLYADVSSFTLWYSETGPGLTISTEQNLAVSSQNLQRQNGYTGTTALNQRIKDTECSQFINPGRLPRRKSECARLHHLPYLRTCFCKLCTHLSISSISYTRRKQAVLGCSVGPFCRAHMRVLNCQGILAQSRCS